MCNKVFLSGKAGRLFLLNTENSKKYDMNRKRLRVLKIA
ncbi:hypothetical protein BCEN4_850030 [Burkholderia cenocepacia]|nr:hypothetical protein BCEN4_850030 [Burkholderia cenocepacia]